MEKFVLIAQKQPVLTTHISNFKDDSYVKKSAVKIKNKKKLRITEQTNRRNLV